MTKITGNEPATPLSFEGWPSSLSVLEPDKCIGLTIRQQFAMADNTPLPEGFCRVMLNEFNKRSNQVRSSMDRHPYELMNYEEMIETRMRWKVMCADALIAELNK